MPASIQPPVVAVVAAPWGPIHVAATERGVVALEVLTERELFGDSVARRVATAPIDLEPETDGRAAETARNAIRAIERFLARGEPAFERLPVDLVSVNPFDRKVFEAVRAIPRGRVTSYGRLARAIGRPGAARAVGGAVGRNPIGLVVPCHRVVAGDGTIGGYGGDGWGSRETKIGVKLELLGLEGVSIPARDLI